VKAAWYERNGAAAEVLKVGERPEPLPGPGEVRVRLAHSGVNPSDVKRRAGATARLTLPFQVPHSDGSGTIDRVGPGVPESRLGEKVWIWNGAWQRAWGTAAELIALPAEQAVPLPAKMDLAAGACLGIPVMTAHRAVFADGSVTGRTVLVAGGGGVVGHYAVQLAVWAGARTIATVGSEAKAAHAYAAGADAVVDYRSGDVARQVLELTGGEGVDRIVEVEAADNIELDLRLLRPGGALAIYGMSERAPRVPLGDFMQKNALFRFVHVYGMPAETKRQAIADIAAWAATGRARFAIARRFPLAEIVQAHEAVEAGRKQGQVLLDC